MSWDKEELKRTRDAVPSKRKGDKSRKRRMKHEESESSGDEDNEEKALSNVRVSQGMVRYGVRKATFKARGGMKRKTKPKPSKTVVKDAGEQDGDAKNAKEDAANLEKDEGTQDNGTGPPHHGSDLDMSVESIVEMD